MSFLSSLLKKHKNYIEIFSFATTILCLFLTIISTCNVIKIQKFQADTKYFSYTCNKLILSFPEEIKYTRKGMSQSHPVCPVSQFPYLTFEEGPISTQSSILLVKNLAQVYLFKQGSLSSMQSVNFFEHFNSLV